jgi:DNA repair protein RecO (recombination protein O)
MLPKKYTSEGLVLARRNFSEADRILVVYTNRYGKVSLIAKGVRKPKSRKRGSLEVFSLINFSASRGKSLDIITEVETLDAFNKLRKDLKKVSLVYYFMEVIGRITEEGEENKELFNMVVDYINRVKKENKLRRIRIEFLNDVLSLLGYWPKDKVLEHPDAFLQDVVEKQINSFRVGKKILE